MSKDKSYSSDTDHVIHTVRDEAILHGLGHLSEKGAGFIRSLPIAPYHYDLPYIARALTKVHRVLNIPGLGTAISLFTPSTTIMSQAEEMRLVREDRERMARMSPSHQRENVMPRGSNVLQMPPFIITASGRRARPARAAGLNVLQMPPLTVTPRPGFAGTTGYHAGPSSPTFSQTAIGLPVSPDYSRLSTFARGFNANSSYPTLSPIAKGLIATPSSARLSPTARAVRVIPSYPGVSQATKGWNMNPSYRSLSQAARSLPANVDYGKLSTFARGLYPSPPVPHLREIAKGRSASPNYGKLSTFARGLNAIPSYPRLSRVTSNLPARPDYGKLSTFARGLNVSPSSPGLSQMGSSLRASPPVHRMAPRPSSMPHSSSFARPHAAAHR
jgi:hypothetical protein